MDEDRPQVRVDGSGTRPLVVKQAPIPGPAAERLRGEIALLAGLQHPGVVEVLDARDDDHGVIMRTRFCGSRTLANIGLLPVARAAGILAALATTVADLHDLGIRHGRITADHVLIAVDGRPVLCGFAEGARGDEPLSPADDVHDLGVLLREILAPLDDVAPIPTARVGRRGAWTGYQRRALLNLADQATGDDAFVRPTARQLANNLRTTVPDATLAEPGAGTDPSVHDLDRDDGWVAPWRRSSRDDTAPSNRLVPVGLGAAAIVLVATLTLAMGAATGDVETTLPLAEPADTEAERELPTGLFAAATAEPTTPPTTTPPTSEPPAHSGTDAAAGCSAGANVVAATADGTPCAVEVALAFGVLTVADEEFHVGLPNAQAAIGDFGCVGRVRPAVVDLDRGDVYVFERWATDGDAVTATALQRVAEPRRLLAEPASEGCHRLVVLDRFGIRHVIDVAT